MRCVRWISGRDSKPALIAVDLSTVISGASHTWDITAAHGGRARVATVGPRLAAAVSAARRHLTARRWLRSGEHCEAITHDEYHQALQPLLLHVARQQGTKESRQHCKDEGGACEWYEPPLTLSTNP